MYAHRIFFVVILSCMSSAPALACSYNKLDLDYCGDRPTAPPRQEPIYKPDFKESPGPSLPDPHPTVVTPRDSRGKQLYGVGVEKKF
jgi:hypothetical protein